MPYAVSVERRESKPAAVIRLSTPPGRSGQFIGPAYGEIGGYLHELDVEHDDALVFARFIQFEPQTEVEVGFTVSEAIAPRGRVVPGELPGGEVAVTVHVGGYATLPNATQALRGWMVTNG